MTDLDLAAIRQRVEKATEGPWNTGFDYEKNDPIVLAPGYIEHTIDYTLTEGGLEHGKADAEFIAHAREDIPALLAEIDRLNATIQRVREDAISWVGKAWDDGNATGLDGWVGPGRGTLPIDREAQHARTRMVHKADRALEGGEAS